MFYVYILRSSTNDLYIGQTNDLLSREVQQITKSSKAAKFIKDGKEFKLVYKEEYPTRLKAMHREKQLKGWTRAKKEALIAGDSELLKKL
ncbi:MAG: tRNA/rRNA methyltransferase [uncultured bacterium]|nr:MAG: tRNA/rRNA methyltransferase [uncultured bacterium]